MLIKSIKSLFNSFGYSIEINTKEDKYLYKYQNINKDKRCIIIGNGPSLNKTNMKLLENEISFGLNKIYLLFPKLTFRPTYMVSYIPDVIEQSIKEYVNLKIPLFVSQSGKNILRNRKYETLYFGKHKKFIFSLNPAKEICVGHTVTYVALQLAFYMGFKKVILIGVDHNFGYSGAPDTWHTINKGVKNRHFDDNYFSPGQSWQSPNLKMSEAYYTLAKAVFEKHGREIINSTIDTKLDVFKKESLELALDIQEGHNP